MPTPREGESREDFVDRCIPIVIEDGTAEDGDQAVAICNSMWEREMETKAIPSDKPGDYLVVENPKEKSTWHLQVKENGTPNHRLMGAAWAALHSGFRGNKYEGPGKQKAIQKLISLYKSEKMELPSEKGVEAETLIAWGGAVKALGGGKIGGYLVRFTDAGDNDLEDEFFNSETDFGGDPIPETGTVYYQHGQDQKMGKRKLSTATHRLDEFGIWAETQLKLRDEYEKFIYAMAEKGKLGWSSGTASHLVERQATTKGTWIKSWPLGLDDTLTPVPAEPRNEVVPLKMWQPEELSITMTDRILLLNAQMKILNDDLSEFVNSIDKPLSGAKRKELQELLEQCAELNTVYSDLEQVLEAEPYGKRAESKRLLYQLAEKRKKFEV